LDEFFVNHASFGVPGDEHPLRTPRSPDDHDRPLLPHLQEQTLDEPALPLLAQDIENLVQQQTFKRTSIQQMR
jgi:hypothetical protein